jgi:hypothetical protein
MFQDYIVKQCSQNFCEEILSERGRLLETTKCQNKMSEWALIVLFQSIGGSLHVNYQKKCYCAWSWRSVRHCDSLVDKCDLPEWWRIDTRCYACQALKWFGTNPGAAFSTPRNLSDVPILIIYDACQNEDTPLA